MNSSQIVIMLPNPMGTDIHICRICKSHFYALQDFIVHKMHNCLVDHNNRNHLFNGREDEMLSDEFEKTSQNDLILFKNILNLMNNHDSMTLRKKPVRVCQNIDVFANGSSKCNSNGYNNDGGLFKTDVAQPNIRIQETGNAFENIKTQSKSTSTQRNSILLELSGKMRQRLRCTFEGCSYTSLLKKDLERHSRIHTGERPFKCPLCNKLFTRSDKLQVHQRIHSGKKPYKCTDCDYASVESGSLAKHMRIHKDIRPFRCQLCTYRSRDKSQLTVHLRTHTGDAPFVCTFDKCKSAFKTNSDLKRHSNIHLPTKAHPCPLCPFRSSFKNTLMAHITKLHPNEEDGIRKPHCCPHCPDMPFKTIRKLKNHLKKKHNTPDNAQAENKLDEKNKSNKPKRKMHEKGVDVGSLRKDFNCSECTAAFVSPENLRIHELQHLKHKKLLSEQREANLTDFYVDCNRDKMLKSEKSNAMLNLIDQTDNLRTSPVYLENGDLEVHLKTAEMLASLSDLQLGRTYSDAAVYFNSDDELNNATMSLNL